MKRLELDHDGRGALLLGAALVAGLIAAAASLGFVGTHLASLPMGASPFSSLPGAALLATVLIVPVLIELLILECMRERRSLLTWALLIPALLFVAIGWLELLRLAPRVDGALSDGPGAWMMVFPVGAVAVIYVLVLLLPAAVLSVRVLYGPLSNKRIERTLQG